MLNNLGLWNSAIDRIVVVDVAVELRTLWHVFALLAILVVREIVASPSSPHVVRRIIDCASLSDKYFCQNFGVKQGGVDCSVF